MEEKKRIRTSGPPEPPMFLPSEKAPFKKRAGRFVIITLAFGSTFVFGCLIGFLVGFSIGILVGDRSKSHLETESNQTKVELKMVKAVDDAPLATVPTAPTAVPDIAVVGRGEGIEHAFIRQLVAYYKYKHKGDSDGRIASPRWVKTKAHYIAILAGYVDLETRNEVRVKAPGGNVAYVLQIGSGGRIFVAQFARDKDGNFPSLSSDLAKIQKLADDYQSVSFVAALQPYEYLWTCQELWK